MTSLFENLNSPYAAMEDDSGQRVLHVRSFHVLVQAAGYLKHALAAESPCSVLFRGQAKLHNALTPRLYRGVTSQKMKMERDEALQKYIDAVRSQWTALKAVADRIWEPLLQHYGIRTKWLDLVDNIWVALWFACHNAVVTGGHDEYLHFEQRIPGTWSEPVYVLFLRSDAIDRTDQAGLWRGEHTELVDLRIAAPSTFLRPHAQHAVLMRRHKGLDHNNIDYRDFVVGVVKVELESALRWLGGGSLLTAHYDFGYRDLLDWAPQGNEKVGTVHNVGA